MPSTMVSTQVSPSLTVTLEKVTFPEMSVVVLRVEPGVGAVRWRVTVTPGPLSGELAWMVAVADVPTMPVTFDWLYHLPLACH